MEETKKMIFQNGGMIKKKIIYSPGLLRIFECILQNAFDHYVKPDNNVTHIMVDIGGESNTISIFNDGKGIPIEIHKDEEALVPTVLFGRLPSSSEIGNRLGFSAKICNIFSTKFVVETVWQNQHFEQVWEANMEKECEPKIIDFHVDDYTKITFCPDLTKFKMTELNDDIVILMSWHVYDVSFI